VQIATADILRQESNRSLVEYASSIVYEEPKVVEPKIVEPDPEVLDEPSVQVDEEEETARKVEEVFGIKIENSSYRSDLNQTFKPNNLASLLMMRASNLNSNVQSSRLNADGFGSTSMADIPKSTGSDRKSLVGRPIPRKFSSLRFNKLPSDSMTQPPAESV
jgi:hypothetical protein